MTAEEFFAAIANGDRVGLESLLAEALALGVTARDQIVGRSCIPQIEYCQRSRRRVRPRVHGVAHLALAIDGIPTHSVTECRTAKRAAGEQGDKSLVSGRRADEPGCAGEQEHRARERIAVSRGRPVVSRAAVSPY